MLDGFLGVVSKIPVGKYWIFDGVINGIMRLVYGLYFGIIKAIAWVLDMLTQLFFIFAGMTPVGTTVPDASDGVDEGIDIVNFFLTQKTFQKAYLYLCLVALGLIVVFAIGKIIKQDYFDRSGPRSKGPIFRSIALSFIAFICIIPVFYFLIDAAAALAMLVMKAMGYKGGGIGTIIFNISWSDGGYDVRTVASNLSDSKIFDPDNFGWYSGDTFYSYYWDEGEVAVRSVENIGTEYDGEFYWYIFIFTGLILIVNLGKMMLSMVTRMYNLIALFIVAPSPISQIVLDDGQKFKGWKDKVIQEALKVVGCVMSFMLFIMIVSVVNNLDLMKFAFTSDAATASLLEDNNLTTELSNIISPLYYYGGEEASWIDNAINALGRCMIIIAGVGAITDIDQTITPFISGGGSSMDMGNAGKAIASAGGAVARGALEIGRKGVGLAVSGASAAVSLTAGAGMSLAKGASEGFKAGKGIASAVGGAAEGVTDAAGGAAEGLGKAKDAAEGLEKAKDAAEAVKPEGEGTPEAAAAEETNDAAATPEGEGAPEVAAAEETSDAAANPEGEGAPEVAEAEETSDAAATPEGEGTPEAAAAEETSDAAATPEGEGAPEVAAAEETSDAAANPEGEGAPEVAEAEETSDAAATPEGEGTPEAAAAEEGSTEGAGDSAEKSSESKDKAGDAGNKQTNASSAASENNKTRFATMHSRGKPGKGAKIAKVGLGVVGGTFKGASKAALGITGKTLKYGGKFAGTAAKTGLSIAGIMAKTVLSMTGMGGVAHAVGGTISGIAADTAGTVRKLGGDLKKQGAKFSKDVMKKKRDANGNLVDKEGNAVNEAGYRVDALGKEMLDESGNKMKGASAPVYDSPFIDRVSKFGNGFKKAGGAVGSAFNGGLVEKGLTAVSSRIGTGYKMDKEDKQALDETVNGGTTQINKSMDTIDDIESRPEDVVAAMDSVIQGSNEQLNNAAVLNEASETYTGERNEHLEYDAEQASNISEAMGVTDEYSQAGARSKEISSHIGAKGGSWDSKEVKEAHSRAGIAPQGKGSRSNYLNAIRSQSAALDKKYEGVLSKVKSGEKLSGSDIVEYAQYKKEANKLDNAYLFVHSGYGTGGIGEQSFGEIKKGLESTKAFTSNKDPNKYNNVYLGEIQTRAETDATVGNELTGMIEGASIATKLGAASQRLAADKRHYEAVMADGNSTAEQQADAITRVQESAAKVQRCSAAVRSEANITKGNVIDGSRQNVGKNAGNAKYEKAVQQAKASIASMEAKGASAKDVARAKEQLEELENESHDTTYDAYQDVSRGGSTVHGTRKIKAFARKVDKKGAKALGKESTPKKGSSEAKKSSSARMQNIASGKPSMNKAPIEVEVSILDNTCEAKQSVDLGSGDEKLSKMVEAYRSYASGEYSGGQFAERICQIDFESNMAEMSNAGIEDVEFEGNKEIANAIARIKAKEGTDDEKSYLPQGKGNMSLKKFRKGIEKRYERAVETHNENIQRAAELAHDYASSNDPAMLKAVNEALAKAVASSEEIRIIKTELGIGKKPEDKK